MPVVLNKVERGNPLTPSATKKWYVTVKTVSQVDEGNVARQIADETTLNRKEAEMALAQFEKVLLSNLLASNSVQMGGWGSFHLSSNSTGATSKEALTTDFLKGLNLRFQPGKALKEALAKAHFVFAEDLVSKPAP